MKKLVALIFGIITSLVLIAPPVNASVQEPSAKEYDDFNLLIKDMARQIASSEDFLDEISSQGIVTIEEQEQEKEIESQLRKSIELPSIARVPVYDKYKFDDSIIKVCNGSWLCR